MPCHALAMHRPSRSSQGDDTARPSSGGLWATCPRSTSSGYHMEFHEGCYQKHTKLRCRWPVWNQTFVMACTRKRAVAARYKKDDLLDCWTISSDISGYHADFHEGHGTVGAWQGNGMGATWARHTMCKSALRVSGQLVTTDTEKQMVTALYPKCHPYQKCFSPNPAINVVYRSTGGDTLTLVVWNVSYTKRPMTRSNTDRYWGIELWPWRCTWGPLFPDKAWQRKHIEPVKNMSFTFDWSSFLCVRFIKILRESNLCTALTRYNTSENSVSHNGINSPTQDTTALKPDASLTGIRRLLVINI